MIVSTYHLTLSIPLGCFNSTLFPHSHSFLMFLLFLSLFFFFKSSWLYLVISIQMLQMGVVSSSGCSTIPPKENKLVLFQQPSVSNLFSAWHGVSWACLYSSAITIQKRGCEKVTLFYFGKFIDMQLCSNQL